MKNKTISLDKAKKEIFSKNRNVKKKYDSLAFKYAVIELMIDLRSAMGLTQQQLAKKMKTTQSVIARMENANAAPSTKTIEKYAAAMGLKPVLTFEPLEGQRV